MRLQDCCAGDFNPLSHYVESLDNHPPLLLNSLIGLSSWLCGVTLLATEILWVLLVQRIAGLRIIWEFDIKQVNKHPPPESCLFSCVIGAARGGGRG